MRDGRGLVGRRRSLAATLALAGLLGACGPPPPAAAARPTLEEGPPLTPAELLGPVGHWAAAAKLCARETWTISDTALVSPDGRRCALRAVVVTSEGWRARLTCPGQTPADLSLEAADAAGDVLRLQGGVFGPSRRLVRCGRPEVAAADLEAPVRAAMAINRRIRDAAPGVEAGRLGAGLHFARIWRIDGEVAKITAPIGGGPQADRDRSYYFAGGRPFLISGPSATYALGGGRIVAWFTPSGRLVSALTPDTPSALERDLLVDAVAVQAAATQAFPGAADPASPPPGPAGGARIRGPDPSKEPHMTILSPILAALLTMAPAAPAPTAPAAAEPPAERGAPEAGSEAELSAFARATIALHGLSERTPEAMAAAIGAEGLDVTRYNALAAAMGSDPGLSARVNALMQTLQQASAAPATPGQAAAPAATLTPELPTEGDGAVVVAALSEVCLPMVRADRPVAEVGPAHGFKRARKAEGFTRGFGGKGLGVTVFPRGANEAVCRLEIRHAVGAAKPIIDAATVWAALAKPALALRRNDVADGADGLRRRTLSWDGQGEGRAAALVLVQVSRPDGTPLDARAETISLLYSEQPASGGAAGD